MDCHLITGCIVDGDCNSCELCPKTKSCLIKTKRLSVDGHMLLEKIESSTTTLCEQDFQNRMNDLEKISA